MTDVVLFHNPSCSKSRAALELLESSGLDFETVLYLKSPPDRATLERIVHAVGGDPARLVRDDPYTREVGIDRSKLVSGEAVVEVLLAHPRALERPVVLKGTEGAIGRPIDDITALLG